MGTSLPNLVYLSDSRKSREGVGFSAGERLVDFQGNSLGSSVQLSNCQEFNSCILSAWRGDFKVYILIAINFRSLS